VHKQSCNFSAPYIGLLAAKTMFQCSLWEITASFNSLQQTTFQEHDTG